MSMRLLECLPRHCATKPWNGTNRTKVELNHSSKTPTRSPSKVVMIPWRFWLIPCQNSSLAWNNVNSKFVTTIQSTSTSTPFGASTAQKLWQSDSRINRSENYYVKSWLDQRKLRLWRQKIIIQGQQKLRLKKSSIQWCWVELSSRMRRTWSMLHVRMKNLDVSFQTGSQAVVHRDPVSSSRQIWTAYHPRRRCRVETSGISNSRRGSTSTKSIT